MATVRASIADFLGGLVQAYIEYDNVSRTLASIGVVNDSDKIAVLSVYADGSNVNPVVVEIAPNTEQSRAIAGNRKFRVNASGFLEHETPFRVVSTWR